MLDVHFATLESGGVTLAEALQELIEGDFRSGRTHDLEGWMLSRTECELCAAAASIAARLRY